MRGCLKMRHLRVVGASLVLVSIVLGLAAAWSMSIPDRGSLPDSTDIGILIVPVVASNLFPQSNSLLFVSNLTDSELTIWAKCLGGYCSNVTRPIEVIRFQNFSLDPYYTTIGFPFQSGFKGVTYYRSEDIRQFTNVTLSAAGRVIPVKLSIQYLMPIRESFPVSLGDVCTQRFLIFCLHTERQYCQENYNVWVAYLEIYK